MATRLEQPVEIGGCEVANRLYRAPLLECAGNGQDAVDTLIAELEPAAAAGAGLIFQGATIPRPTGGCVAPNMTRVHDPAFLSRCERLTDRIDAHGGRLFLQLDHGGLRSLETWHAGFRDDHRDCQQLAVSRPPWILRALERLGFLAFDVHVMETDEVYELAADFGRAAAAAVDAGYHGIHLAGANMGLIEQFCSPLYNRRDDEFGGNLVGRTRFLDAILEEIRSRADDVPVVTKIPAESVGPRVTGQRLSLADGVALARRAAELGFDGVVPVTGTGFWDASIVRGKYPARAWSLPAFQSGYDEAFGGGVRHRLVRAGHRLQAAAMGHPPAWNEAFCRRVQRVVDVPVLAEGGIRDRATIDRLLRTGACDLVGMARPFYAEPRLPARMLDGSATERVVCESCNNCTVPQATGASGVCRTPSVLERHGELVAADAYRTDQAEDTR